VLFDKDDGGQIMVTYDAPPPAIRPRYDNSNAMSFGCTPTTALGQDEDDDCERQRPPVTENELQRQKQDTQQVAEASSAAITATSKSELCDEEQATKTRNKNHRGSVAASRRPQQDQKAATIVAKQKEPRTSVSSITSTRRQSLGPLPFKKSTVSDQRAVVNGSVTDRRPINSDISKTNASRAMTETKAETRFSSASRSVSTSRRSSLMKATASSLAKRCENSADNDELKDSLDQAVTGSNVSFTGSLTSKITKLVKGGSKPAGPGKAAAATSPRYNKRLSLDASTRPRSSLITGKTEAKSQRRDNEGGRKATARPLELSESTDVSQGHRVTSSTPGVVAGRGQLSRGSVQGSRTPAASFSKSSSAVSLRSEVAKSSVVKKSVSLLFFLYSC